jgi:hypothetical protein
MKRDRFREGEERLKQAEALLRKTLLEVLPSVIRFGWPVFTNSKHNPYSLPSHLIDEEAEAIWALASSCIDLREYLAFDVPESVGHLFLEACEESASSNAHRRGPRKLAEAILEQLRNDG